MLCDCGRPEESVPEPRLADKPLSEKVLISWRKDRRSMVSHELCSEMIHVTPIHDPLAK
jgi:hypothetical protein